MGFKEVAFGAIGYVNLYKGTLTKALLIPFVLYMSLDVIEEFETNTLVEISTGILGIVVQTIFAIITHRIILLGPGSVASWGALKWSKRETLFALHVIGLMLLMIPIFAITILPIGIAGLIVAIVLSMWIVGRLSLVFPGIAIDQGVSFKTSWELTKNYQLLMFLVVVVFPILLLIPSILISALPYTLLISSFLSTLATVFTVAALSVSYKLIYKEVYES